ncbi:hypothetical protein [Methylophilus aquaticus]|uniref:Radical SAM protein n=1 Tax=Methylophilus aquaticus TaxID=1971610 RepID=A0ABT9JW41_9PROT|nr:hypothetical protein [Methylophilus aquaticus]MDP8568689.1 hypothetical protein [Methylophilus aquaticus]
MEPATLFAALSHYAAQQQWQYVYPVLSRRAQGLSLGINLHPNHACNWQCIYCQVHGLHRGHSPIINVPQLMDELQGCLQWLIDYLSSQGLLINAVVSDIAFAGDGEPTTSLQFPEAIEALATLLAAYPATQRPQSVRVITNGSQLHHGHVQHALRSLSMLHGEVWFKLDAGTDQEMLDINQTRLPVALHLQRLKTCCQYCRTWVQTAIVTRKTNHGLVTTPSLLPYIELLDKVKSEIAGVLLYGIARPGQQPLSSSIAPVSVMILEEYAETLRNAGYQVSVFA